VKTDTKAGADIKANDTKATDTKTNATQTDKAGAAKSDNKASMDSKTKSSMDTKANDKNKAAMDSKANDKSSAQNNAQGKNTATTGQGAAGAKANLSTEQQTKIRTVIKEKVHVQPLTKVNFSISVGTRVPRDVHFYAVPAEVISIYPEWRGYKLILVNNQYIIVDPNTYEIVYIIA
jgi:hypothetical protein